jgi:hypothetical protein
LLCAVVPFVQLVRQIAEEGSKVISVPTEAGENNIESADHDVRDDLELDDGDKDSKKEEHDISGKDEELQLAPRLTFASKPDVLVGTEDLSTFNKPPTHEVQGSADNTMECTCHDVGDDHTVEENLRTVVPSCLRLKYRAVLTTACSSHDVEYDNTEIEEPRQDYEGSINNTIDCSSLDVGADHTAAAELNNVAKFPTHKDAGSTNNMKALTLTR